MTAPVYKTTAQQDALVAFVKAVLLEVLTAVNVAWGHQDAPQPNPHAAILFLENEEPFATELYVDSLDVEQRAGFETARLRVELLGSEYRLMEHALRFAHTRLDLLQTHLDSVGVAWRGQFGGRTELTGLAGSRMQGASEVAFAVAWRSVDTRAVSTAKSVRVDINVDGVLSTDDFDIDISP